jgi:AI-2 transport protein TqsA
MIEKIDYEFDADTARRITDVSAEIAARVRLYLGITTLKSVLTGIACGLWTVMLGLDLAIVWGVLNFLLNYVPVVGNLIGIIPPSLYALMQFQNWTIPAAVFVGLAVIQIAISNFVYPVLQGRGLSLSPVAILLAVAFWTWVWGIAGALIAVPLTVVLVVICEHFAGLRWITVLMSVPKSGAR